MSRNVRSFLYCCVVSYWRIMQLKVIFFFSWYVACSRAWRYCEFPVCCSGFEVSKLFCCLKGKKVRLCQIDKRRQLICSLQILDVADNFLKRTHRIKVKYLNIMCFFCRIESLFLFTHNAKCMVVRHDKSQIQ